MVKLPYDPENRHWLRGERHRKPTWNARFKCWETPKAWLEDVVIRLLQRFGRAYLIAPYREVEKCAPAYWDAVGLDCECSCVGANHGMGRPDGWWYIVSEACAVQWGERRLSCRLLEPGNGRNGAFEMARYRHTDGQ